MFRNLFISSSIDFELKWSIFCDSGCIEYHGCKKSIVSHIKESEKDHNMLGIKTKIWSVRRGHF